MTGYKPKATLISDCCHKKRINTDPAVYNDTILNEVDSEFDSSDNQPIKKPSLTKISEGGALDLHEIGKDVTYGVGGIGTRHQIK